MIDCTWLKESRCGLAEQLTGVEVRCAAGACAACRSRHPVTPTVDSPGTVVASLATRYGTPAVKAAMRPHLLVVGPTKLVQINSKNQTADGVGSEVSRILKSFGIPPCQQCAEFISWMDSIGVDGCRLQENREKILKRLRGKAAEASWATKTKAAVLSVATGMAFQIDWSDPMPGILDEAVRIVSERESKSGN